MRLYIKLFLVIVALSIVSGCATAKQPNQSDFYTYQQMKDEIHELTLRYPQLVTVHEIAQTQEGRSIILLEISNKTGAPEKPGLLATFAQHSDEHETTEMAMKFVNRLLEHYGTDATITKNLNEKTVYVIPMVNPDGADYDLSSEKTFLTWRKNRTPVGKNNYGIDLNRNWGYYWDAPANEGLNRSMNNPEDSYYHGQRPFSENETQSISEFIINHKNIKIFADYHTGDSNSIQGDILIPFCYTKEQKLTSQELANYEAISSKLCSLISDSKDTRAPYAAMPSYKIKEYVWGKTPLLQKPLVWFFLPSSTLAPGAAIDWAASQGILALGIEMACSDDFSAQYPASRENLINHQFKGFLFLLNSSKL